MKFVYHAPGGCHIRPVIALIAKGRREVVATDVELFPYLDARGVRAGPPSFAAPGYTWSVLRVALLTLSVYLAKPSSMECPFVLGMPFIYEYNENNKCCINGDVILCLHSEERKLFLKWQI